MQDAFTDALDSLDFETVRSLIADAEEAARPALKERFEARYASAEREARRLASDIQRLARQNAFAELLSLDADPRTDRLIQLLPEELARGSEVQLEGARKWHEQRIAASRRHLKRAGEAISIYDTVRAKADLLKVDTSLLTDAERALYDDLQDQLTAAELERMELQVRTQDVLAEHKEVTRARRRKQVLFWAAVVVVALIVGFFVGL